MLSRRSALAALAAAALTCVAASPAAAQDAADRTLVPGQRVGAITKDTPPADLAKIYGADRVRYEKIHFAEGNEVPGARVLVGTPDELEVGFTEDGRLIEFIRIRGDAWATAEGIRVGTPLADLERINGGPFQFYGFQWDHGGVVLSSARGKLPRNLTIILGPTKEGTEALRAQVAGDRKISSRHRALPRLDVRVNMLVQSWPR